MRNCWYILVLVLFSSLASAQDKVTISGTITDEEGNPVISGSIAVLGTRQGAMTNDKGFFSMEVAYESEITLAFSCVSYVPLRFKVYPKPGEKITVNKRVEKDITELGDVTVFGRTDLSGTSQKIQMKSIQTIPTTGSGIETLLKTLPGVSSNNELSSQYNVRGGSFDENLIYVNDVEIYRPFLIRSGQQEGLSFINSDLVESLKFSAGGFDAMYGDKMSSVLDITYRKPTTFAASASASMLGANLTVEDMTKNKKLSWMLGARYKTNQYLLNTLDTKGEYKPTFGDIQTSVNYFINEAWTLSFLGSLSINKYKFVPDMKKTTFGTIAKVYELVIDYDGQELDHFNTSMGAMTLQYQPRKDLSLKFIGSAFNTSERETYDLMGQYWINELGSALDQNTDNTTTMGVGSFLMHGRNALKANVLSFSHKGLYEINKHKLRWGATYQREIIHDRVDDWTMIDSAGYSLPFDSALQQINIFDAANSVNHVFNNRIHGYIQDVYKFKTAASTIQITYGVRAQYSSFTNELTVSPRASVSYNPDRKKDVLFYFSTGYYPQMPFYREMRDPEGKLNRNLRSQKSYHFVLGSDYNFMALSRPFKFTTEIFYKYLWDLVPYKIENVRLQYAAMNMSSGHVTGIDFKVNGEFVRGTESWVSLSLMQAREDIKGDVSIDSNGIATPIGKFPRPTDQIVHLGMFLQDYLPNNPTWRASIMVMFGTGLPVNNPFRDHYEPYQNRRLPSYRRVDLGITKILKSEKTVLKEGSAFRHFKEIWVTGEVLNLFNIENTVSYMWLRSVGYQSFNPGWFAVPNYLTPRLFNLKLTMKF